MIIVHTHQHQKEIQSYLANIEGLNTMVKITPLEKVNEKHNGIIIEAGEIISQLPWSIEELPILFSPITYQPDNLAAILLSKLGYEEEALEFTKDSVLCEEIKCRLQLRRDHYLPISFTNNSFYSTYNQAVLTHYAGHFHNGVSPVELYEKALKMAPSDEHKAFVARHLAVLLMDQANYTAAENLLRQKIQSAYSDEAKSSLSIDLINILLELLRAPFDPKRILEIKQLISNALDYFNKIGLKSAIASLYTSASEIANMEKNYTESMGYISKAITIYEEEHIPEFLSMAFMRKGTLLYTWAQDGNPQFYQKAINTYQEALKTFSKEEYPHIYAEIHHNLAVIYAEMPVDEKKKAMWAAFSATSFKECLEFYNKETFPYEYAMVANNYANALLKYPPAKMGDNSEKAVGLYLEALEIRHAHSYPIERAHTILNYLEACWQVHNINKNMERARYNDMLTKAKEVKRLTDDEQLIAQANEHLDQLSSIAMSLLN
jgi:tetratricopeptide (TPR) repeat protein